MDQRAQSFSRRLGLALAILVAFASATAGIALANHQIAGLYHDDGIYLSTARSLAEQGSYRLINLPGAPFATKYPPLYPSILAVIWKVAPEFPANLALMKAVNAALLGGIALLTYLWLGRLPHLGQPMRLMIAALTSFAPGLFYFCDLVLTEMLFTLIVLGVARVLEMLIEIREQACPLILALAGKSMALHCEHAAHRVGVDVAQELRAHGFVTDLTTPFLADVTNHAPIALGRRLVVLVLREGGVERALLIHEAGRGARVVHAVVGGLDLVGGLADAFEPGAERSEPLGR